MLLNTKVTNEKHSRHFINFTNFYHISVDCRKLGIKQWKADQRINKIVKLWFGWVQLNITLLYYRYCIYMFFIKFSILLDLKFELWFLLLIDGDYVCRSVLDVEHTGLIFIVGLHKDDAFVIYSNVEWNI